jgi:hypothetical protein
LEEDIQDHFSQESNEIFNHMSVDYELILDSLNAPVIMMIDNNNLKPTDLESTKNLTNCHFYNNINGGVDGSYSASIIKSGGFSSAGEFDTKYNNYKIILF